VVFNGGTRRHRLVRVLANRQPTFACYVSDSDAPAVTGQGLIMLTLDGTQFSGVTRFLDNGLLPRFGVPASLPDSRLSELRSQPVASWFSARSLHRFARPSRPGQSFALQSFTLRGKAS
jgi:hypothetical protein